MRHLLLTVAYCVPYAFLALHGDLALDTSLLYGAMAAAFLLLGICAARIRRLSALLLGNIGSFAASWLCALYLRTDAWGWYFKPFTGEQLLITLSVVMVLIQLLLYHIYKREATK